MEDLLRILEFAELKKNLHEMGGGVDLRIDTIEQNIDNIIAVHG